MGRLLSSALSQPPGFVRPFFSHPFTTSPAFFSSFTTALSLHRSSTNAQDFLQEILPKMGCMPSRPSNNGRRSFYHAPRYPQVPPGQTPQDCAHCTAANRKVQQKCSNGCTATRRSNLRPKWNPNNYPTRHSWEIYEEEMPW